jgi:Leucine-rich repeat (LRR) protein
VRAIDRSNKILAMDRSEVDRRLCDWAIIGGPLDLSRCEATIQDLECLARDPSNRALVTVLKFQSSQPLVDAAELFNLLTNFENLRSLDLTENHLGRFRLFPKRIFRPLVLRRLRSAMRKLPQLSNLNLSYNELSEDSAVLAALVDLPALTDLSLAHNAFNDPRELAASLMRLQPERLRSLNLSSAWSRDTLAEWSDPPAVDDELNDEDPGPDGFDLEQDPPNSMEPIEKVFKRMKKLRCLSWSSNELSDSSRVTPFLSLPAIEELDLSDNGFAFVDAVYVVKKLSYLPHLKWLNIQDHGCRNFGPCLSEFACKQLEHVTWIDRPRVRNSTSVVGGFLELLPNFTGVTRLAIPTGYVGDRSLPELKRGLSPLTELEMLDLYGSHIRNGAALADCLSHLKKLERLVLRFSESLDDVAGLAVLLPENGGSLRSLDIVDCPCIERRYKLDPSELLTTNANYIFRSIERSQQRAGERLPLVKAMILGDGRVGKSRLRCRLMGRSPELKDRGSTHDFEVEYLPQRFDAGNLTDIEVRLFDMGGQPELHAIHRLFLASERNVYLIVCRGDLSPEEAHLPYWLRMVRFHGHNRIPIIIVQSWADKGQHAEWDRWNKERVEADFGLLSLWVRGYCDPESGRSSLSHDAQMTVEIIECVGSIIASPAMVEALSVEYHPGLLNVKRWIEGMKTSLNDEVEFKSRVSCEQFARVCEMAGASCLEEVNTWQLILSHLGLITYAGGLPDADEPQCRILKDWIFRPEWIKRPVYGLIRDFVPGSHQSGMCMANVNDIETFLRDLGLEMEDARAILALMRATRMIFEVRNKAGLPEGYLLVDRLMDHACEPLAQNPSGWRPAGELELNFLAESYLPRLIGVMNRYLCQEQSVYRTWAVFRFGAHTTVDVLVLADLNAATVRYFTAGGDQRSREQWVGFLREQMRELMFRDQVTELTRPSIPESGLTDAVQRDLAWFRWGCEKLPQFSELTREEQYEFLTHPKTKAAFPEFPTCEPPTSAGVYEKHLRTAGIRINDPRSNRKGRSTAGEDER